MAVDGAGGPAASPAYDGSAGGIGRIALVNAALNLLTLGFYRFWGKTRLRRYLWRNFSFQGDGLEYTGLPKELLIGFLIALAVLIPLFAVSGIIEQFALAWAEAVQIVSLVVFAFLFQFAFYRARRYRLTRTTWRGIRGGQTGSSVKYALIALGQFVVLGISAGLSLPLLSTTLQRFRMENTWIGDRRFSFEGRARDLFGRWFLAWLLFIPTLGLSYVWYKAAQLRYFAKCTIYENLRLELPVTGRQLFGIYAVYGLALIAVSVALVGIGVGFLGFSIAGSEPDATVASISIGAALGPLVMIVGFYTVVSVLGIVLITHRLARLLAANLLIIGEQDFAAIAQSNRDIPGSGEGLADALDVGGF